MTNPSVSRLREGAWLSETRRLADSNCWKPPYAANQEIPACSRFSRRLRPDVLTASPRPSQQLAAICKTATVTTAGAAVYLVERACLRFIAITTAVLGILVLCPLARARRVWHTAIASAYSHASSGPTNGCDGSQLHDRDRTFASFAVPCGARVRFCIGHRCVVGVREDSGPYVAGRLFDLNVGIVRALGFPSCAAFGVRTVTWERVA